MTAQQFQVCEGPTAGKSQFAIYLQHLQPLFFLVEDLSFSKKQTVVVTARPTAGTSQVGIHLQPFVSGRFVVFQETQTVVVTAQQFQVH